MKPYPSTPARGRAFEFVGGRWEGLLTKVMVRLLVAVGVLAVIGAQHITYLREMSDLSAQLRQKEQELRAEKQANQSLQYQMAVRGAQAARQDGRSPAPARPGRRN